MDDVGRGDAPADELLRRLLSAGLFVSAQIVPAWLQRTTADRLRRLARSGRLELGQHGWSHSNHAPAGERFHEFGPSRSLDEQSSDIRNGINRLADLLGPGVAPVFSPPWDRLDAITVQVLAQEGFRVITAGTRPFGRRMLKRDPALAPVAVDASSRGTGDVRRIRPAAAVAADIRRSRRRPVVVELHAHEFGSAAQMDEYTAMFTDLGAMGFRTGHFCSRRWIRS